MKRRLIPALLLCALLLSGCGSFLNREFSDTEPHSATYFGGDDRSVLRVESYQDLVSGLLMLVSDRAAEATVWLYPSEDMPNAAEAMERACREVQQVTPLGAYAVGYLTYTIDDTAHNYAAIRLTVGYRRSAEQVSAMVHTTGISALYDLLPLAAQNGLKELVIRASYFDQTREEIRAAVEEMQLQMYREEEPEEPVEEPVEEPGEEPAEEPAEEQPEAPPEGEPEPEEPEQPRLPEGVQPWLVNFYPAEGDVGIVEVLLSYEEN